MFWMSLRSILIREKLPGSSWLQNLKGRFSSTRESNALEKEGREEKGRVDFQFLLQHRVATAFLRTCVNGNEFFFRAHAVWSP